MEIIGVFLVVTSGYFLVYHWIENRRQTKGPWEITFGKNIEGTPAVSIRHTNLAIASMTLFFPGETTLATNLPQTILFDEANKAVPFGEVIYEDLTFLPGVVTFNLFDHAVECMPRTLILNSNHVAWNTTNQWILRPEDRLPEPPTPPKGGTRDNPSEPSPY